MTNILTEGNIRRQLITLAVPLILGNILQQFYNTIDALVIGQFAGTEEFAAIGIAGTVMNLFLFIVIGICTGFSILLAASYGARDLSRFRKQHFSALLTGLLVTLLLAGLGLLLLTPLLRLIATPEVLIPYTMTYLRLILLSLPAAYLYNFYAALLRSVGNTRAALYVLAAAVGANLLLDLLLVAVFRLGIFGAAAATALTQLFSALSCFLYLLRCHRELLFGQTDCQLNPGAMYEMLRFGSVTALHHSGLYIGKMLVQGVVNTGGTELIAAYTAASRVEGFINSFGDSGASSTSILVSQNHGAGKTQRVREAFFTSLRLLLGFGILSAFLLFAAAPTATRLLLGDNAFGAVLQSTRYLRLIALFYLFCFTGNTFAGYYNGIGRVVLPFVGAVGHITLRVILSALLFSHMQLSAVALASGIGWVLVNLFWSALLYFRRLLPKE